MSVKDKERIYYTRTYRRIKMNIKNSILFLCLAVLPVLILFLFEVEHIIHILIGITHSLLSYVIPEENIRVLTTEYSVFWKIEYLDLPTVYPQFSFTCVNLIVCLMIFVVINLWRKTGKPFVIFSFYCLFIHVVSCVYFIFSKQTFAYTTGDYSSLYLKQQIGIWMMFIVMSGVILGVWGDILLRHRIFSFLSICVYSLVFGALRYIVFMFVLYRFSVLYMAIMFFVIGPIIDFSYFVMIYAAFMNKLTKEYDQGQRKGEWGWS